MRRSWALCAVPSLLLTVLLLALGCSPPEAGAPRPAPDFEHPDLEGRAVRLESLRGKTVVIDFWATWCEPCRFQPGELNAFMEAHRNDPVVVLGIEVGGASVEEIHQWAAENDAVARYPILTGADTDLAYEFGASGFPATAVVTPDGQIGSMHLGVISAQDLEDVVGPLLERAPPASPGA